MAVFSRLVSKVKQYQVKHCDADCALAQLEQHYQQDVSVPHHPQLCSPKGFDLHEVPIAPAGIYSPLITAETRIVELLPGNGSEPLACSLWRAMLIHDNAVVLEDRRLVTYECVSYTWGHGGFFTSILCNNKRLLIQVPLAEALLYLRYPDKPRFLWCDAICINQKDDLEKASQVQQMLLIFEKARAVVGWIGAPSGQRIVPGPEYWKLTKTLKSNYEHGIFSCALTDHTAMCKAGLQSLIKVLLLYLSYPWFTRAWIRQEGYAANQLFLQYGYEIIDFQTFIDAVGFVVTGIRSSPTLTSQQLEFKELSDQFRKQVTPTFRVMARDYQHRGVMSEAYIPPTESAPLVQHFLNVLHEGSRFDITDDRDRVYAMLGMLFNEKIRIYVVANAKVQGYEYPVHYDIQVAKVYHDILKFLIDNTGNVAVLNAVFDRENPSELASWAIDWRQRVDRTLTLATLTGAYYPSQWPKALKQDVNDERCLCLRGKILSSQDLNFKHYKRVKVEMSQHQTWIQDDLLEKHNYIAIERWCKGQANDKRVSVDLLIPPNTRLEGQDRLVALDGNLYPVVLRDIGDGTWKHMGPAYSYVPPKKDLFSDNSVIHMQLIEWKSNREFIIV